jgi:hypothetical protein
MNKAVTLDAQHLLMKKNWLLGDQKYVHLTLLLLMLLLIAREIMALLIAPPFLSINYYREFIFTQPTTKVLPKPSMATAKSPRGSEIILLLLINMRTMLNLVKFLLWM